MSIPAPATRPLSEHHEDNVSTNLPLDGCECNHCERARAGAFSSVGILVLSTAERQLLRDLRTIDFFRAQRDRTSVLRWNGVRLVVLDSTQVSS